MNHEDLTELLHRSPHEFVLSFLTELGDYEPRDVVAYRPRSWLVDNTVEVHEYCLTKVDSTGGCDGDGEYMDVVFKVASTREGAENDMLYFRVSGSHNSWADPEWFNDFDIVEPREVTVTQWFPK